MEAFYLIGLEDIGPVAVVANIQHASDGFSVPDEEAEFDAPETVEAIRAALCAGGADAVILEADADLPEALRKRGIRFVFNIAEGRGGRDREAQIPGLLSLLGIPYSGSDALVMALTLDKALCKRLAASLGIRTAPFLLLAPGEEADLSSLTYPVLVKPNAEGSGKGITERCVAEDEASLRSMLADLFGRYPQEMLIEPYLPGREFTVGVLGNGKDTEVFPPMEIVYRHPTQGAYSVYSYEVKKDYRSHVDYVCPADIPDSAAEEMTSAARSLFGALGCRDLSRVDFRMDAEGRPCFLELNPLPGLAPGYSDYPMAAEAAGYGYEELIRAVALAAAKRLYAGEAKWAP